MLLAALACSVNIVYARKAAADDCPPDACTVGEAGEEQCPGSNCFCFINWPTPKCITQ